MRRPLALSVLAITIAATALPLSTASALPVQCAAGDLSPDGRVFPEPDVSLSYVAFDEFVCGMAFLESKFADLMEIEVIGQSSGGNDVYVIRTTDETVTTPKGNLYVMSSIHGGEIGGREGAFRNIEDIVDPRFDGDADWVQQVLDEYIVHWSFPNPDGWLAGEGAGAYSRGNVNGTDLNRNYPVRGYIAGTPLSEDESVALDDYLQRIGDWYLGTDNHGQGGDTYAAAGLQIVGQFDYDKSETLARFADGITAEMGNYPILENLEQLNAITGQDMGPYHWGTLYDMLGYSASGSVIDYYNTPDIIGGYGFATELTAGAAVNQVAYPALLNSIHVDAIRAINNTLMKQAIEPVQHVFPVGGRAAYLFDPIRITDTDADGRGYDGPRKGEYPEIGYDVSRMKFFSDLNDDASEPLTRLTIADVVSGAVSLSQFDSLVISDNALPGEPSAADSDAWFGALSSWVEDGGNLILTDGALTALNGLGVLSGENDVTMEVGYVGSVETFTDRSHPLNADLRGVASQTYDTVPLGYSFGGALNSAPNWKVDQAAWEAAGGFTAGTNGLSKTIYGEVPVGEGRVRILGALLPNPTEANYHPFGLQNYAVTYTGYTLLANMLVWDNPNRDATPAPVTPEPEPAPEPAPLPTTGGGAAAFGALALGASMWGLRRRR